MSRNRVLFYVAIALGVALAVLVVLFLTRGETEMATQTRFPLENHTAVTLSQR